MALKITSAERLGPVGCQHYNVSILDGSTTRTQMVEVGTLQESLDFALESGAVGLTWALVLLWARRRLQDGATLAQILNVNIVP